MTKDGYTRGRGPSAVYLTTQEFRDELKAWLQDLSEADCCITMKGRALKCNCLSFLADKPVVIDAVASALIKYFHLEREVKQQLLANEYRHSKKLTVSDWNNKKGSQKTFGLPLFYDSVPDDVESQTDLREANEYFIDLSAWTTLFNLREDALESIKAISNGTRGMLHASKGKSRVSDDAKMAYESINELLTDLQENRATPFATKYCREVSGHTVTREDSDRITLPPSMSYRQIYYEWCRSRGWKLKWLDRCKARLAQISDWECEDGYYRTQAEADQHEGGKVAKPIVSYRSFIRYWKRHFSKLVIRKRGEDTCDICHALMLKIQRIKKQQLETEKRLEEAGDDDNEGTTVEELKAFVDSLKSWQTHNVPSTNITRRLQRMILKMM